MMIKNQYYIYAFFLCIIYVLAKANFKAQDKIDAQQHVITTLQEASKINDLLTSDLFIYQRDLYERTADIIDAIPDAYGITYSDDFMQLYRKALGYE